MKNSFLPAIQLASGSPRRKSLLTEAGFDVEIVQNNVEETYPNDLPLDSIAKYLAELKIREAKLHWKENFILLTADSTVILNGDSIGKPDSENQAIEFINKLSGQTHEVITGVCLYNGSEVISLQDTTKVTFDHITWEEAEFYVKKYKPFDKAGAYGIQEWLGLCKIIRIEGSYSNVMGLPIHLVYKNIVEISRLT